MADQLEPTALDSLAIRYLQLKQHQQAIAQDPLASRYLELKAKQTARPSYWQDVKAAAGEGFGELEAGVTEAGKELGSLLNVFQPTQWYEKLQRGEMPLLQGLVVDPAKELMLRAKAAQDLGPHPSLGEATAPGAAFGPYAALPGAPEGAGASPLAAVTAEPIKQIYQSIRHPINTFRERPLSMPLDLLAVGGLFLKVGTLLKAAREVGAASKGAAGVKATLTASGVPASRAGRYAGTLDRLLASASEEGLAKVPEPMRAARKAELSKKIQAVLLRAEQDIPLSAEAQASAISEAGKTRGLRPLKTLASKEEAVAKHVQRTNAVEDTFNEQVAKLTNAYLDAEKNPGEVFKAAVTKLKAETDNLIQEIQNGVDAGRISEPQASAAMQGVWNQTAEKLAKMHREAAAATKKAPAVPTPGRALKNPKPFLKSQQAGDVTKRVLSHQKAFVKEMEQALRKRQTAMKRSLSVYEAEVNDISKMSAGQTTGLPLMSMLYEGEGLSNGMWRGMKGWMIDNVYDHNSAIARFADAFSPLDRILMRTPAGRAFAKKAVDAEVFSRMMEAKATQPLGDIFSAMDRGTRKWVRENFNEWYRAGAPSDFAGGVPPKAIELAAKWKEVGDQIWAEWAKLNGWTGAKAVPPIGFYLPNYLTTDARFALMTKDGPIWDAIVQRYGHPIAEKLRESVVIRGEDDLLTVHKSPSLEFDRTVDLSLVPEIEYITPGGKRTKVRILKTDPHDSMMHYLRDATRRIGTVTHFGRDVTEVQKLLNAAGGDAVTRLSIRQGWFALQGMPREFSLYSNPGFQVLQFAETAARTAHLSVAVIPNLTGALWVARKWGLANMLDAQWYAVRSWELKVRGLRFNPLYKESAANMLEVNRMLHGWARNTLAYTAETEQISKEAGFLARARGFSQQALKWTGLERVERNTNRVAGVGARLAVEDMFNKIRAANPKSISELTGTTTKKLVEELKRDFIFDDNDIMRIMREGMNEFDHARVVQRAPALVNAFNEGALSRRYWMRHPISIRMMAYMSWRRVRHNMTLDALNAAMKGDFAPIVKEFGYSLAAGEMVGAARDFFRNQERTYGLEEYWRRIGEDMSESAATTFWGSIADMYSWEIARSGGESPGADFWNVARIPAFDFLDQNVRAVGDIFDAYQQGRAIDQTGKAVGKLVPALGTLRTTALRILDPERAAEERRQEYLRKRYLKGLPPKE